jgi:hypothetical protein
LTDITKNIVSGVVVVSLVDPASVTEGSIRVLVQKQFPEEKQKEILNVLLKAHRDALPPPHPA